MAFTGFVPMFTYVAGVINNDALVGTAVAAVAWRWMRILRFGATGRETLLLGLLLGLSLTIKETAAALLPRFRGGACGGARRDRTGGNGCCGWPR